MRTILLIVATLFAPVAHSELTMREGDNYIDSDEGRIVLFALPGCEVYGNPGLYGFAEWKTGKSEIICWKYDRVVYVYTTEGNRTIIFDPSDVKTKGTTEEPSTSYSAQLNPQYASAPVSMNRQQMVSFSQPVVTDS